MSDDALFTSATAWLPGGVRLHYRSAGEGEDVVVLLHGWPQTSWEWRHVIPLLADAGYRVVAPDARGAGHSSRPDRVEGGAGDPRVAGRPRTGYDKWSLAGDVHALLTEELEVAGPVAVVGHDVGAMVAVAYALRYRQGVRALGFGEAPIPGTRVYEQLKRSPPAFHFGSESELGLPGAGKARREAMDLQHFFDRLGYAPETVDTAHYAAAYAAVGVVRAGADLCCALEQDAQDNRDALHGGGLIDVPTLAFSGQVSSYAGVTDDMAHELADDVLLAEIPRTGHWVPEENPRVLARVLVDFLRRR